MRPYKTPADDGDCWPMEGALKWSGTAGLVRNLKQRLIANRTDKINRDKISLWPTLRNYHIDFHCKLWRTKRQRAKERMGETRVAHLIHV